MGLVSSLTVAIGMKKQSKFLIAGQTALAEVFIDVKHGEVLDPREGTVLRDGAWGDHAQAEVHVINVGASG